MVNIIGNSHLRHANQTFERQEDLLESVNDLMVHMDDMESVLPFVNENSYHNFCTEIIISSQEQAPEHYQSAHDFCDHFLKFHDTVLPHLNEPEPLYMNSLMSYARYNNGTDYLNNNPIILPDYFYRSEKLNKIMDFLHADRNFSYPEYAFRFNFSDFKTQMDAYMYAKEGMAQMANPEEYSKLVLWTGKRLQGCNDHDLLWMLENVTKSEHLVFGNIFDVMVGDLGLAVLSRSWVNINPPHFKYFLSDVYLQNPTIIYKLHQASLFDWIHFLS